MSKAKKRSGNDSDKSPSTTAETKKSEMLKDSPSRWQSWWVRFRLSVIMIVGFGAIIYIGHWAVVALVLALQIGGFRELCNIRDTIYFDPKKKGPLAYESTARIDIAIFAAVQYICYGLIIYNHFSNYFLHPDTPAILVFLAKYHSFISFSLLMTGLVMFVASLQANKYLQQFQYMAWTVMTLVAVMISNFHIANIFNGLVWFLLPVSLIICNDIMAYIWGFFIGKTSLIQLSPKKTWEGFIGAAFSTIVFAYFMIAFLNSYKFLVFPMTDITGVVASGPKPVPFSNADFPIPEWFHPIIDMLGMNLNFFTIPPVVIYAIIFAIFASTVAPFGGFLASGFKRAYGIKDFGTLIPGHGGIVDRMDCQVMMAAFSYVFYNSFVVDRVTSYGIIEAVGFLPLSQQLDIFNQLTVALAPINI